jgi:hypothetical protein
MRKIQIVRDEGLPEGHDFACVQQGVDLVIFYRESAVSPCVVEESQRAAVALRRGSDYRLRLRAS